jgi:hypothetical protein
MLLFVRPITTQNEFTQPLHIALSVLTEALKLGIGGRVDVNDPSKQDRQRKHTTDDVAKLKRTHG